MISTPLRKDNSQMKYAFYNIPSRMFPKAPTELIQGVTCFKSKIKTGFSKFHRDSNGLLIDLVQWPNHIEIASNFIVVLNLFRQEYASIQWLSQARAKDFVIEINEDLDVFIAKNHFPEPDNYGFNENFNQVIFHHKSSLNLEGSVVEVYQKFSNLEQNSFLSNTLRYLAINDCLTMTTNRIYENASLENATLFQLFEAILDQYASKIEDKKEPCPECKRPFSPGIRTRIRSFLVERDLDLENIRKSLFELCNSRNKFFHYLKGSSSAEYWDSYVKKTGSSFMSFDDEIKHADGTGMAQGLVKVVLTYILLKQELKCSIEILKGN